MKAIVYTSNTGSTAEYAKMLAQKCNLPLYCLEEAEKAIPNGSEIIFLGWLMAGRITDYKKAAKCFNIKAVCAVGLCETGTLTEQTRSANKIANTTPLFTLQGAYRPEKLNGIYKLIMKFVTKALIKKIDGIASPTESDKQMRITLQNGGSYVCEENLKDILRFMSY